MTVKPTSTLDVAGEERHRKIVLEQTLNEIINGKTIEVISNEFPRDWAIIVFDIPLECYTVTSFYRQVNFSLRNVLPSEKIQQSVWAVPKGIPLRLDMKKRSRDCFVSLEQISSEIIEHGGLAFIFEAKKVDVEKIMDKAFNNRVKEYQKIIEDVEKLDSTYDNISDMLGTLQNVDSRLWYKPYVEKIEVLRKKAIDKISELLQKMKEE